MNDIQKKQMRAAKMSTIRRAVKKGGRARTAGVKARDTFEDAVPDAAGNDGQNEISYADTVMTSRGAKMTYGGMETLCHGAKRSYDGVQRARQSKGSKGARPAQNTVQRGRTFSASNRSVMRKPVKSPTNSSMKSPASDSARRVVERGVKSVSIRNAKRAERDAKRTTVRTYRALKKTVTSSKNLLRLLAAGGSIAILVILVCTLFGAAFYFFGDESSSNYTAVSAEVEAYAPVIEKYAAEYGIAEYVDLIKAVMMQESGGKGTDPMQAAEGAFNTKYPKKPNGITDPDYSIRCGVQELKAALKSAGVTDPLDITHIRLALQGYNYGNGYIPWAIQRDGGYTVENAATFSEEQAKKHGWTSYGDKLYVAHVLRYYPYGNYNMGIGNTKITQVAALEIGNVGGEKYWRWYGFTNYVEWCACYVSWCAEQCGYIEEGIIPKFASVAQGVSWFKGRNQWQHVGYQPAPGDIIFLDWQGDGICDHVGIVEKSDDTTVYTIEGNSFNMCRRKSYSINSQVIYGYGVPKY